ncbi:Lacal_2735 family protein [Zunongwangia sp. HRR-M8]|uniref:Lacal_2735 family protein n=1 Tax=Zunongwangia sp. HRR-M8 TaxID=3015170 RepID=UPI0022DDF1EC|nr:Lacal_2735 family protein [Zunongwangia sp. HRR-M8]WBL21457.1 Lacal_2735 family protein [Zunongwangia sp. HRR-M8]
MFRILRQKSKEECMCAKYTQLMHKAYKLALVDKDRSDKINAKARKILQELRRMHYLEVENWATESLK